MDGGRAEDAVEACATRWSVTGMSCAACAARLERVVDQVEGVSRARVEFASGMLLLEGRPDAEALREAVRRAGFEARPMADEAGGAAGSAELVRVAVAAAFGMQSMMIGIALASEGVPPEWVRPLGLAAGLVSVPAVLWAGAPLLRSTARALREGGIGVDGLVGLGSALTWLASWVAVATGHGEVWFDTAAMLIALHLGGRVVEARVRRRATQAVRAIFRLAPATARREGPDGRLEEVPLARLRPGDRLHVLPMSRFPVDGVVREGRSSVDRSLLTGEAAPVDLAPGAPVEAGTRNGEGALVVEATAVEGQRRIDAIARAVERALGRRPALVRQADRVAGVVVPLIGLFSVGTGLLRLLQGQDLAEAMVAAAAVIVVTCPCALTLAAPIAVAAAAGAAADRGLVFRDAEAIDRLATAREIWFDKTGTLTEGRLAIGRVEGREGEGIAAPLALAASLGAASPHPAAQAVARLVPGVRPSPGARSIPGEGVELLREGRRWRLGRAGWASERPAGREVAVDLGVDGAFLARFELGERLLSDAREALAALRRLGFGLRILSGDGSRRVREVAEALAVEEALGGLSPEEKAAELARAAAEGRRVAFVGDGINDAIAHGEAWVGVSPAGAVEVAEASAGVLLLRDGLAPLVEAVELARATRRVIRQNLAWALVYNLLAIPLAAAGLATPLLAAAAMTASSLTVTLNAARLIGRGGAAPAPLFHGERNIGHGMELA